MRADVRLRYDHPATPSPRTCRSSPAAAYNILRATCHAKQLLLCIHPTQRLTRGRTFTHTHPLPPSFPSSFTNDAYGSAGGTGAADSGYMDVSPGAGDDSGYMDVAPGPHDDGGYMDVGGAVAGDVEL